MKPESANAWKKLYEVYGNMTIYNLYRTQYIDGKKVTPFSLKFYPVSTKFLKRALRYDKTIK